MAIKLLLLSLLLVSCGKKVNMKPNKLESIQQVTEAGKMKYEKMGLLDTSARTILYEGKTYKVSIYSSKTWFDFISALPAGSQIPILFTGGVGNEIVVEGIQRR